MGLSWCPFFEPPRRAPQIECEDRGMLNPMLNEVTPPVRREMAASRRAAASAAACCTRACARAKKVAHPIAKHAAFKVGAMVVIVANALLLSLERYDPDPQLNAALRVGNYVLTALFACEIAVRYCAFGHEFWVGPEYRLNWVEAFILLISIADVIGEVRRPSRAVWGRCKRTRSISHSSAPHTPLCRLRGSRQSTPRSILFG